MPLPPLCMRPILAVFVLVEAGELLMRSNLSSLVVGRWSSKSKFASDTESAAERNSGRGVRHVLPRLARAASHSQLEFSILGNNCYHSHQQHNATVLMCGNFAHDHCCKDVSQSNLTTSLSMMNLSYYYFFLVPLMSEALESR